MIVHAFNLSQGYICTFAKGGNKPRASREETDPNVIIEVPTELPLEWSQRVNRDHEAEFHYIYADQAKDSKAVYILKMKAGRNLVTNKIKIEVKVERTKFSADCEEPLHARPKHTYMLS